MTYGKAMQKFLPGWTYDDRQLRRHGLKKRWYTRDDGPGAGTSEEPGPLTVPAHSVRLPGEEPENDKSERELDLEEFDFGLDDL